MAIYPDSALASGSPPPASAIDIEAWTIEQAAEALSATSLSQSPAARPNVRGASVTIDIPLDEQPEFEARAPRAKPEAVHTVYKRREPIRRDSLKRRDALLRGKEGSRRRQRWENGT